MSRPTLDELRARFEALETAEVVTATLNLLLSKGWCKGAMARDDRGREIEPDEDDAATFCLLGALERVDHEVSRGRFLPRAQERLAQMIPSGQRLGKRTTIGILMSWNDDENRTIRDVVALLQHQRDALIREAAGPSEP